MNLVRFKFVVIIWFIFDCVFDDFFKDISIIVGCDSLVNFKFVVNIVENKDGFVIELVVFGLMKEDFNVSVEKNILMISVSKEIE